MIGQIHIFRRSVVNGFPHFQVNFTSAGRSYAKVVESEAILRELLIDGAAVAPSMMDQVWAELDSTGKANINDVEISENDTAALGMVQADSDF